MKRKRIVIVFDGLAWYVRRLALSVNEGDQMVYYCDKAISNDHATLLEAAGPALKYLDVPPRQRRKKRQQKSQR